VAKDKGWFTDYKPVQSTVYKRDGQGGKETAMAVHSIGTVELAVRLDPQDASKTGVVCLVDVLHVPQADTNIISHKAFAEAKDVVYAHRQDGTPFPNGKVSGQSGETLVYFRDVEYPEGVKANFVKDGKGHVMPFGLVELAGFPAGYTLGESTLEALLDSGRPLAGWVTWKEEDKGVVASN
jgi:hypothetical protein